MMQTNQFKGRKKDLDWELQSTIKFFEQHFSRTESRETVGAYLKPLLSRAERKNTWQMAESVGMPNL